MNVYIRLYKQLVVYSVILCIKEIDTVCLGTMCIILCHTYCVTFPIAVISQLCIINHF